MTKDNGSKELLEEIKLYIKYAVPESDQRRALSFVEQYKYDSMVLALMREYYSTLPEAREEDIIRLATLMSRQGVFLLVAVTESKSYLYAVSGTEVVFLTEYGGEVDEQVLAHFGFHSQPSFQEKCIPVKELEDYRGSADTASSVCSACGVLEGEFHLLGCSVEVCPWCDGQLSNCNCRFEQLGVEELESEEQLSEFNDLLAAKGRIPFDGDQSPTYPGAGDGMDSEEAD